MFALAVSHGSRAELKISYFAGLSRAISEVSDGKDCEWIMDFVTIASFLFFTGLVGFLTWRITRGDENQSTSGYFLAGRSLTFPLIAGSLLLTNLSTEQMVGLNGDAFTNGFCVMVWEVVSVISMVAMAWFFLPRFLKSGIATVPQYLRLRFDSQTETITNIIFLTAYVGILLPMILYTGAEGMMGILDVQTMLGTNEPTTRWIIVIVVGIIGSIYALFGGLRTVAVSDTLNGIGLLVGGFLITYFALNALGGDAGFSAGADRLFTEQKERFNSIGSPESSAPFGAVFSGIFLLTLFYWSTNQQIIQRTFGASSLAEGQKGVLLTGALKLLGPIYLVIPGMIAFAMFAKDDIKPNQAYGMLVNEVLPSPLAGFFAAVMLGAILSSFNSALNSTCTLFSLGLFKPIFSKNATEAQVVGSGKIFGVLIAITAMVIAPGLAKNENIFLYLQKMNGMYSIPILAVVLVAMLSKRVPPLAAKFGLIAGVLTVGLGNGAFESIVGSIVYSGQESPVVPVLTQCRQIADTMGGFYFTGTIFAWLVILMFVIGEVRPTDTEWVQKDENAIDMTPWKFSGIAGVALIVSVIAIYAWFADLNPTPVATEVAPDTAEVVEQAMLEKGVDR